MLNTILIITKQTFSMLIIPLISSVVLNPYIMSFYLQYEIMTPHI